ncbi:MAG: hypothetical protein EBZ95_12255 [Chitinophagia bacterium]|nr:hypothetical protein [Chitinophagia bacterium]
MFVFEFANAQVAGTPKFLGKSAYPQAFASAQISDTNQAILTGYVIDNGQTPATETGILWGTSTPTLTVYDGGVVYKSGAGTITTTITGLVLEQIFYIRAYAKMGADVSYGNVEIYEHGTVTTETGKKWMAYNLGSSPAKTSNDVNAYNALYQWGRQPYYGSGGNPYLYYMATTNTNNSIYADWLNPENSQLWQGVNGLNNPCPSGYRIPTASEYTAEVNTWSSKDPTGAFNSKLKLSVGGYRSYTSPGSIIGTTNGLYWTGTTGSNAHEKQKAYFLQLTNGTNYLEYKSNGFAVRCIKDYSGSGITSGGTAEVSSYDCPNSGAVGQIVWNASASDVKQIIQANVTSPGTYNLTTAYSNKIDNRWADKGYANGIIFTGSGTFTSTGLQNVELTASGSITNPQMLNPPGSKSYSLINVASSCIFTRTEVDIFSGGTAWISSFTTDPQENLDVFTVNSTSPKSHKIRVYAVYGGTYNISTSVTDAEGNTVTFSGSGSVPTSSAATIFLTSSGKFSVPGTYTFYLPNSVNRANSTINSGAFTRRWQ